MKPVRNPGGAEQLGPSSYSHSIHHRCWRRGLVGCFFVLLLVSSSPWRFSNGNGSVSWVVGASNDGEEENGLTPAITPPPPTIADLDAQDNERFRVSVYLRERRALMGLWRALSHNQGPGIEQQQQSSSKPNTKTDHCQWEGISCVAIPKTVGGSRSTGTTENTNTTNILNTENNNIDEYYTNDGQHLAVVVVSIQWTHRAKHWAGHPLQYDPQQQHSSSVHRKPKQNATAAATALDSGDALDDGNDDDGTVNFDAYWTDLVYLMQLDLSHNQLAGTIPHTLLTHAQLKYLDLSHNQLQNFYYYTNSESDSGTASHGTNQANHNAPWFPSLLGLFLDSNALSGSLRELWDQLATHGMVPESPISGGVEALAPGATATATLVTLDLSDNFLTGTVPSEQMKKKMMMNQQQHQPEDESFFGALTGLWVADNLLTGSLPSADDDRDILFSLSSSKLQILDMSRNLLTGPVGNLLTMGSLKNLHHLILTDNEFMGPFPSIPIAPHPLQVWDLSRNFFTGTIPENSWSMLKDLCTLIVSRNRFIGTLPIAFMVGQASSLGQLDISYNKLTGTIATELGLMSALHTIDAMGNFLTGTIPNEMMGMNPNLRLNFTDNLLTGTIPALFCGHGASSMNMLYLIEHEPEMEHVLGRTRCIGVDFVHGDVDGDGILHTREILRMIYIDTLGRFWGSNFQSWADMKVNECDLMGITCVNGKVARIDLTSAELCSNGERRPGPGPIQYCYGLPAEIGELSSLEVLQLTRRQFLRGTIPTEIGKLSLLRMLDVSGCTSMTGTLPSEIGQLSNLKRLLISHSHFRGTIPSEIYSLGLEKLYLTNNNFIGTISSWVGKLTYLKELMISRNALTGTLPTEMGQMAKLENLEAYHNGFTGSIPSELALPNLKRIDIFKNKLSGSIPEELAGLQALQILHLKDNLLTGTISSSFGYLPFLSWLDVSSNHLLGTIPLSFAKSTTLDDFRLAGNMIYDDVPQELCINTKLNGGSAKQHGCNGVLCPAGTFSENGYANGDEICLPCPDGLTSLYLGSLSCIEVTMTDVLSILYEVMRGPILSDDSSLDATSICDLQGINCDENGVPTSLEFPSRSAFV